jgi:hypothetical protein
LEAAAASENGEPEVDADDVEEIVEKREVLAPEGAPKALLLKGFEEGFEIAVVLD